MNNVSNYLTKKNITLAVLFMIAIGLPYMFKSPFAKHILFFVMLWSICGVAWNILAGYAGQTSLGHALFYGIGAYVSTMLLLKLNLSPWIGMLVAVGICCAMAWLFSRFLFNLSGFYFTIATIALGEIFLVLFTSWSFVDAARGLFLPVVSGGNSLLYLRFSAKEPYYYIAFVFLIIALLVSHYLSISKAGYYFRAIRDESDAAISLGVDIRKYKTIAYMFSVSFCAIAGVLYANYSLYIDPDSVMNIKLSTQICLVAIMGGVGTLWGPIIGSMILTSISEIMRFYLGGLGLALDLIIYSLFIIVFAVFQPNGIIGMFRTAKEKMIKRQLSKAKKTNA